MYKEPFSSASSCRGVNSSDPLRVPAVPFAETVRSWTTGPRMARGARWMRATVAGDRRPSNVPSTVSLLPVSTAFADPRPATVLCIATVSGTVDSRARNVLACCAPCWPPRGSVERAMSSQAEIMGDILKGEGGKGEGLSQGVGLIPKTALPPTPYPLPPTGLELVFHRKLHDPRAALRADPAEGP